LPTFIALSRDSAAKQTFVITALGGELPLSEPARADSFGGVNGAFTMILVFWSLAAASVVLGIIVSCVAMAFAMLLYSRVAALRGRGIDPAPGIEFNSFKEPWRGGGGHQAARYFYRVPIASLEDQTMQVVVRILRVLRIAGFVCGAAFGAFLLLAATQVCWGCR
jgi:hypothetical protein